MALDFTGKLVQVMPEVSGQSAKGPWRKQDFVFETTDSQYPKKACFQAWGDKIDAILKYSVGDELRVSFNIESREYNDKWFTDLRVWKVESASAGSSNSAAPANAGYAKSANQSAPPDFPDVDSFKSADGDKDDLPF